MKNETALIKDLIYLSACAVNGTTPDRTRVGEMDLTTIFQTAQEHLLAATVAVALESAGIKEAVFTKALAKAARKAVIMDAEMAAVLSRLETAGIWYMPMKGALLKDLYPVYGMREMADRDILIDADRADEVRRIMENLGFTAEEINKDYHDCYYKPPVSNFELHRRLIGPMSGKAIYSYYLDGKSRLLKDKDNACGWHFSPEDFYVFMVAHEYKHYSARGTGLRSVLDTYVYLKNVSVDSEYVTAETEKLGISDFERANRELALRLFGGGDLTEEDRAMLDYVLSSGTFGKEENRAKNVIAAAGRKGYFLSRLTLPYARMEEMYPALKKAPVLYPFCWTHRLVYALIFKNKKVMYQLKAGLTRRGKTERSDHKDRSF